MAIKIETIQRKFTYQGVNLPDPNPAATIPDVQSIFAATHPEIANAAIDGPKVTGSVHTYTFVKSVGEKG